MRGPVAHALALLAEARTVWATRPALAEAGARAGLSAFDGGAGWMHAGLCELRGASGPPPAHRWQRWGVGKYGACALAALAVTALAVAVGAWWLSPVLVVAAFYGVEAQMVFLFPLLLDGAERPLVASRRLTVAAGGTARVMVTVLPLAVMMLFGGLVGQGFVRSWCLGCLAVLLWYEELRAVGAVERAMAEATVPQGG